MVSSGWKRIPPLQGPFASLYWTRKPWKTFTEPSSMRDRQGDVEFAGGNPQSGLNAGIEMKDLCALIELAAVLL